MHIRTYQPSDCEEIAELFYRTVHSVNAKDYSPAQLDAWATGHVDLEQWNRPLAKESLRHTPPSLQNRFSSNEGTKS